MKGAEALGDFGKGVAKGMKGTGKADDALRAAATTSRTARSVRRSSSVTEVERHINQVENVSESIRDVCRLPQNTCFLAGTPVIIGLAPEEALLADAAFSEDLAYRDSDLYDAAIAGLAIGVGLVGFRMIRRRKSDLVLLESELILPDEPAPGNTKLILPDDDPQPEPVPVPVSQIEPEPDLISAAAFPFDFNLELHDDFLQMAVSAEEQSTVPI